VRQIYPAAPGPAPEPLGPSDPLRLSPPVRPGRAPLPPAAEGLIAALAAAYASPAGRWVRANMIASADGAVTAQGRSGGLSGPADRVVFTVLRSLADVILVGAGTARAERYGTIRAGEVWPHLRAGRPAVPPIAVITRRLDLDPDGPLLAGWGTGAGPAAPAGPGTSAGPVARTIVLTTRLAPPGRRNAAARTAQVIIAGEREVSAEAAIAALTRLGHRRILVEGGPSLLGQVIAAGLLDELCLTISPVLEGGAAGRITAAAAGSCAGRDPQRLARLRLACLFEDDGFLLARYLRA